MHSNLPYILLSVCCKFHYQLLFTLFQIGDHVGYQDIDTQRKSEKNYKFSFDESELILNDDNADEGENVKKEYEEKDENKELKEEVK